jgi:hypothetical protein
MTSIEELETLLKDLEKDYKSFKDSLLWCSIVLGRLTKEMDKPIEGMEDIIRDYLHFRNELKDMLDNSLHQYERLYKLGEEISDYRVTGVMYQKLDERITKLEGKK